MKEWVYTQEQAQAIKNGDITARNKFFNDNYDRIRGMAYIYARSRHDLGQHQYDAKEMINQLYLDLPYMDYRSYAQLTHSVKNASFWCSVYGGLSWFKENHINGTDTKRRGLYEIRLDQPISEDGVCLGDLLESGDLPLDEQIEEKMKPDYLPEIRAILGRYIKNTKHIDFLLYLFEGYGQNEALRKLGHNGHRYSLNELRPKLVSHYAEIVADLVKVGCVSAFSYVGRVPTEQKEEKHFKLSEEERAKRSEWQRIYRARKRQERNAQTATK